MKSEIDPSLLLARFRMVHLQLRELQSDLEAQTAEAVALQLTRGVTQGPIPPLANAERCGTS